MNKNKVFNSLLITKIYTMIADPPEFCHSLKYPPTKECVNNKASHISELLATVTLNVITINVINILIRFCTSHWLNMTLENNIK